MQIHLIQSTLGYGTVLSSAAQNQTLFIRPNSHLDFSLCVCHCICRTLALTQGVALESGLHVEVVCCASDSEITGSVPVERRCAKDLQQVRQNFVQRLKKPDALTMLQEEFSLTEKEAEIIFELFDKDQNCELSLWEFQQFYTTVGANAHEMIDSFHKLEKDHSGTIDIEQAWDTLRKMKTEEGNQLRDEDIEMLLKTTAGEEKVITLPKFINLMCRLKVYRS
ncbi:uncharacterized protein LOC112557962 [Pomacea canaliculata]|uniref:uncharacterized protein LOC112557962 n=1 Tax=Pomacea canaliculata TaxID=400727 RepID=UPI000D7323A6|nr:uncharacterized protein LOC112557962 [Pomacea canaliculata]